MITLVHVSKINVFILIHAYKFSKQLESANDIIFDLLTGKIINDYTGVETVKG